MRNCVVAAFAVLIIPFLAVAAWAQQPMLLPVHPAPLVIETKAGDRQIFIEVATKPDEHARGLMFRTEMPDNRGMLFVFPSTGLRSFWMKNTPMPLDLLFIGEDGKVRSIQPGEPFSEAPIGPPVNSLFVLELKAGTSEKLGIEEGNQLRHPLIPKQ
ncbi:hypothetical protein GCM10011385_04010 [Nitratireductor aestuarii]|uniref:DUF192 domain-containing protein n=1 Tax=Nitratireductor aestuarii TaxID=1735103 RepID=A0A916VZ62_9HYPH|nr:DUF192 domain-containing protein [Nitratireductor aestuarii]GGA53710.1 hypothetical protein GCM10011385_04010 [Nitratireductor aestuarii]